MKKIFITLLIVSFITRLFFLIWGHPSLTHDEADFFYNGYLISKTGSDINGNKLFFTSGIISAAPNLPVYLSSIFWNMVGENKSVYLARLPLVFINTITPVLLTYLLFILSGSLGFAIIAFVIFNFSPWFLNLSATAGYESLMSLFFSLLVIISLLKIRNKINRVLIFVLLNFLAFNSYMGYRLIAPFVMSFELYFFYSFSKTNTFNYSRLIKSIVVSVTLFLLFLIPVYSLPDQNSFQSRSLNETVFTNRDIIDNVIWYGTYTSQDAFVGRIFANKVFTPLALFLKQWLHTFDITSLFAGEAHPIYGMRILGLFYMTDIFLFLLGIFAIRATFPKGIYPLLYIFLFGGLPFAISPQGVTIALRGLFLMIPYTLLITNGYWYLFKKYRKLFLVVITVLVLNVMSVLLLYVNRIRVMSSEAFHATDKIVIEEVETSPETIHIFPYEYRPFVLLYGFYSSENPEAIKGELNSKTDFAFTNTRGNLVFHKSCDDFQKIASNELVLIHGQACDKYQKPDALKVEKTYGSKDMSGQILFTLGRKI